MARSSAKGSTLEKPALPASPGLQVTLGANVDARQVALIFGDPLAEPPQFVTFAPEQARELARAMLVYADKAEGKVK